MKKLTIISVLTLLLVLIKNPSFAVQTCGDVYPPESYIGAMDYGDGAVNIFDILQTIDIILCLSDSTPCKASHADVPTGTPQYCGFIGDKVCQTDGVIDIFDLLVIINKALGITNCCEYCFEG